MSGRVIKINSCRIQKRICETEVNVTCILKHTVFFWGGKLSKNMFKIYFTMKISCFHTFSEENQDLVTRIFIHRRRALNVDRV